MGGGPVKPHDTRQFDKLLVFVFKLSLKTLFSSAKNTGFRERHLFTHLQYKTKPPSQDIPTQDNNINIIFIILK